MTHAFSFRWRSFRIALTLMLPALTMLLSGGVRAQAQQQQAPGKRVIILGIDGMDPNLLQGFVAEGVMPNFKKFMEEGDFKPLGTTNPPLSPTAWATFITGMDPGGHGIFDFVHRNPKTLIPELSIARTTPPGRVINVGSFSFPLEGGEVELQRRGRAFWGLLEEKGISTVISQMPANFPPEDAGGKSLSGMGTPDILGTPGTFSYYTNRIPKNVKEITGGEVYPVEVRNYRVEAELHGPENSFRRFQEKKGGDVVWKHPAMTVPFTVEIDPNENVARFDVDGEVFILRQGEWSPWIPIKFKALGPIITVDSIARFYMKEVRPDFKLYVSPLQISPENPAMPITTPADWASQLFDKLGYFYTQELPEDTKALSGEIFTGREFRQQSKLVYGERREALDYHLENFKEGLLFFYFSSIDQNCHMLWRYEDPEHPGYAPEEHLDGEIREMYRTIDEALGRTMQEIADNTTLIVMSDHGFSPFYWGVNLNSWLVEKGYVVLKNPARQGQYSYFGNVDWKKTRAYALGLNGLYVNLKGREKDGIVDQADYDALIDDLTKDLLEFVDDRNGNNVVTRVVQTHREFHGPHVDVGPDIIVGYNKAYRSSWKSPLGEFPKALFEDNVDAWSGDHSMDARHVPGVLIANRKITLDDPDLADLTVGVLDEFGVAKLPEMIGEDCLGPM